MSWELSDLDLLFSPGRNFSGPRRSNQRHKGYLKGSIFSGRNRWYGYHKDKQGDREKSRRMSQIQRGIISADQVIR